MICSTISCFPSYFFKTCFTKNCLSHPCQLGHIVRLKSLIENTRVNSQYKLISMQWAAAVHWVTFGDSQELAIQIRLHRHIITQFHHCKLPPAQYACQYSCRQDPPTLHWVTWAVRQNNKLFSLDWLFQWRGHFYKRSMYCSKPFTNIWTIYSSRWWHTVFHLFSICQM